MLRNLRRLAPMIAIIALVFVALLVGNAVLAATGNALYELYAEQVAGDFTVSAAAEENFTVFGSDQLLVGRYLVPPTIVGFPELRKRVEAQPEVRRTAGLVSSAARVEIDGRSAEHIVFGVAFGAYREIFPELEIVRGDYPERGEPGMLVQEGWGEEVIGARALLSTASGRNFTLREAPVTGVFRYPVSSQTLDQVVLVDAPTARALNGYLYGAGQEADITAEEQAALDADVNSLFGQGESAASGQGEAPGEGSEGVDLEGLLSGGGREAQAEEAPRTEAGAWNFLLVSLRDSSMRDAVMQRLESDGYTKQEGYLVRGWQESAGGTAQLVWFLRLMFNAGLLLVSFGAAIIATNALVLSVLERTGEIGTFRALGASRLRVSLLITMETALVVLGAGAAGVLAGWAATDLLNRSELVIDNQYIRVLFGGKPLRGEVSLPLVFRHLAAAFALTAAAVLYPLKRALAITPVEAMNR